MVLTDGCAQSSSVVRVQKRQIHATGPPSVVPFLPENTSRYRGGKHKPKDKRLSNGCNRLTRVTRLRQQFVRCIDLVHESHRGSEGCGGGGWRGPRDSLWVKRSGSSPCLCFPICCVLHRFVTVKDEGSSLQITCKQWTPQDSFFRFQRVE